jgi:hypothetical protein
MLGTKQDRLTNRDEGHEIGSKSGYWNQSMEHEWAKFPGGMFLAVKEEEMKTRREELESHDGADIDILCTSSTPAHERKLGWVTTNHTRSKR